MPVQPHPEPLAIVEVAGLVALCLWAAAVHFWIFRQFVWDDAYITYRYAQNLAEGYGLVFNPGDRLLGTTSPLYALLLAVMGALGAPIAVASAALYSLFLSAAALQGALLLRWQGSPVLSLWFAVLVLSGLGNVLHFFGMETTLLLWLLTVVLAAAERDRPVLLGFALGLAVLCRYDAAPALLILAVLLLVRRGPSARRASGFGPFVVATGALVATVLPWFVFAQLYFGSILPTTLAAKSGDMAFFPYLGESLRLQLEGLHPLRRVALPPNVAGPLSWAWLVLLLLPLPWVAFRLLPPRLHPPVGQQLPARVMLLSYPLIAWIAYGLIGPPVQHRWHLVPASFLLTLLGALAWGRLLRRPSGAVARWASLVLAGIVAAFLPAAVREEHERLTQTGFYRGRAVAYREMAQWITRNQLTDLPLATIEPGYLCYLTRNPAIDFAGLVTRGLYFHGPQARRTSMGEVIGRLKPPFLVTSFGHAPGRSEPDYVTVWDSFPSRQLLLRKTVFQERFERLLLDWRRPSEIGPGIGHPFLFELEGGEDGGLVAGGGFADGPRPGDLGGSDSVVLATDSSAITWQGGETPPLRIDFDEIAFRFASTQSDLAVAQLVVEGQVVFQSSADRLVRPAHDGGDPSLGPVEMVWPVRPWRGRTAVLRFVDVAPAPHFLAADHIRSLRDVGSSILIDDFEDGGFGDRWETAFAGGPYPLADVARERGMAFAIGEWAAASLDRPGVQVLRSRPFSLDRGQLSMVVLDLSPAGEIDLRVEGRRRRSWRSRGSGRLVPLTWDVSRWRGRSAVLEVRDGDPAAEAGIGVDEIMLFDRSP